MTDHNMNEFFILEKIDIHQIIANLKSIGVTSVRILKDDFRIALLREAESYTYESVDEFVGSGQNIVQQQMSMFGDFPPQSKLLVLKNAFQALIDEKLSNVTPNPFDIPLQLNSMKILKYDKLSVGITAHRDRPQHINLICNFSLGGQGTFYVCADRSGKDAQEIDTSPGNVLIMRAPGFFNSYDRPYHFVSDIRETRYIFGLRQNIPNHTR